MKKTVGKTYPKNQNTFLQNVHRHHLHSSTFVTYTYLDTNVEQPLNAVISDTATNTADIAALQSQGGSITQRQNHPFNYTPIDLYKDNDTGELYYIQPSTTVYTPPSGYVCYYTFDNISGSTLIDETGNYNLGIVGTLNSISGIYGNGGSLVLGTGNRLEFSSTLVGFPWENTTISFFIAKGGRFALGCGTSWTQSTRRLWVRYDNPGVTAPDELWMMWGQGNTGQVMSIQNITDTWIHVIIETSGPNNDLYRVYVNNIDKGEVIGTLDKRTGLEIQYMGAMVGGTSSYQGRLTNVDEVVIYNRLLTASERAQLAQFPT